MNSVHAYIKTILVVLLLICTSPQTEAKTSTKKSITSLNTLILPINSVFNDNRAYLLASINDRINLPRFYKNQLPSSSIQAFQNKITPQDTINPTYIEHVFNSTIKNDLLTLLNSPDIKKTRAKQLNQNQQKITFAETKGKSTSLTKADLETLLNSAYIYIPYIKDSSLEIDTHSLTLSLEGGLIWYKVTVDEQLNSDIQLMQTITTKIHTRKQLKKEDYTLKGLLKKESILEAKHATIHTFAEGLILETRKLQAFKLQTPIKQAHRFTYLVPIGTQEGIHIDDTFLLKELIEENNQEKEVTKGLVRIAHVAKNDKNIEALSTAKQWLGKPRDSGGWIEEYPLTNFSFRFKTFNQKGLFISKSEIPELDLTSTKAFTLGTSALVNLAPYINKPQLFITLGGQLGFPNTATNASSTGSSFIASWYTGVLKKIWFHRYAATLELTVGTDEYNLKGTSDNTPYSYKISAGHTAATLGIERLFTPTLSAFITTTFKAGFSPSKITIEKNNTKSTLTDSEITTLFSKTNFSSSSIQFGVTYVIKSYGKSQLPTLLSTLDLSQ